MSVVLWPRQEVLQLVIPQLGSVGRVLNNSTILDVIQRLSKVQTDEGKISFDCWSSVARDLLKWNDYCIHLFWEMLILAVYYLNPDSVPLSKREDTIVDIECVTIFLVLHIPESQHHKIGAAGATSNFDSVWPLNAEGEVYPSSPVASPSSSPVRESNRAVRAQSPVNSPISPRSPRNSPQPQQPGSPKRSLNGGRTPRGSTQYLHLVRVKIPLVLRALFAEDQSDDNFLSSNLHDDNNEVSADIRITKRMADAFGLVVCGGHSRDNYVAPFSSLYPAWAGEAEDAHAQPGMDVTVPAKDFIRWINMHLSMNDLIYPASLAPFGITAPTVSNIGSSAAGKDANLVDMEAFGKDSKNNQPHKQLTPIASLTRFNPTVINVSSATVIHSITAGPSRASSFRRPNRANQDSVAKSLSSSLHTSSSHQTIVMMDCEDNELFLAPDNLTGTLNLQTTINNNSVGNSPTQSPIPTKKDDPLGDIFDDLTATGQGSTQPLTSALAPAMTHKPESTLPQLFVSYCSKSRLYMLSPYYSASITGCLDSDIVISSVFGAVIVNGCERVKLTVCCRKLIVLNCLECEFNIATMSSTIVLGDSRNLTFGPYNTCFRSLRQHLKLTELTALLTDNKHNRPSHMMDDDDNTSTASKPFGNCLWSSVCDVNACLEALTNGNQHNDFDCDSEPGCYGALPTTPCSVIAAVQHTEQFHVISIPSKTEHVSFEFTPLPIPAEYLEQYRSDLALVEDTKIKVANRLQELNADPAVIEEDKADLSSTLLASSAISKRFMEWLVASDNIQEVLDLIRIDSEKASTTSF